MDLNEEALEDMIIEIDKFKIKSSLIFTDASSKVIWPGIKDWWDKVYDQKYLSEPELVSINEIFYVEQEAKDCCEFLIDFIDNLKVKLPIKVIREITINKISIHKYSVNTQFIIQKPIQKEHSDEITATIPPSTAI